MVFFPDDFYANVGIDARGRRSTRASWISHRPTRRAPWASLRFKFGSRPCPRLALALARPALRALSLRPPLVPRPTALRALPDARVPRGGVPKVGDHDPSAQFARVHAQRHRARPEWRLRRALGRLRCHAASRPSANLSSLRGPSPTGRAAIQSGKFLSYFLEQLGVGRRPPGQPVEPRHAAPRPSRHASPRSEARGIAAPPWTVHAVRSGSSGEAARRSLARRMYPCGACCFRCARDRREIEVLKFDIEKFIV